MMSLCVHGYSVCAAGLLNVRSLCNILIWCQGWCGCETPWEQWRVLCRWGWWNCECRRQRMSSGHCRDNTSTPTVAVTSGKSLSSPPLLFSCVYTSALSLHLFKNVYVFGYFICMHVYAPLLCDIFFLERPHIHTYITYLERESMTDQSKNCTNVVNQWVFY